MIWMSELVLDVGLMDLLCCENGWMGHVFLMWARTCRGLFLWVVD